MGTTGIKLLLTIAANTILLDSVVLPLFGIESDLADSLLIVVLMVSFNETFVVRVWKLLGI